MMGIIQETAKAVSEIPDWQVCVMGIGVVFVGLVSLVLICMLFGAICKNIGKKEQEQPLTPVVQAQPQPQEIPNRAELVAAISAVLGEELGTDVAGIRILSLRRR